MYSLFVVTPFVCRLLCYIVNLCFVGQDLVSFLTPNRRQSKTLSTIDKRGS